MTLINIKHFENIYFNNFYFCCNFFNFLGFDTLFGDENDPQTINRKISPKSIPKQNIKPGFLTDQKDQNDYIKTRSNNVW